MYYLFVEKDLDLIEINPLGVNANGELMALDGKISVNDYALQRHPDIISLTTAINQKKSVISQVESKQNEAIIEPVLPTLIKIESGEKNGNIGIISNSFGLSLTTWDLIYLEKGKPNYCLIIGQETSQELLSNSVIVQQLEQALDQLLEQKLKVILINIVGDQEICQNIAQAIANYIQPQIEPITNSKAEERTVRPTGSVITSRERSPQFRGQKKLDINQTKFVIRLIGGQIELIKQDLTSLPIYWLDNLEQAINQTVNLSKIES
jgi:succinyl-CoA synthetase beta subunit